MERISNPLRNEDTPGNTKDTRKINVAWEAKSENISPTGVCTQWERRCALKGAKVMTYSENHLREETKLGRQLKAIEKNSIFFEDQLLKNMQLDCEKQNAELKQ